MRLALCALAVLASPLVSPAGVAAQPTLVEDFTTATYKDTVHTTAEWDTTAGELRLPPFAPGLAGAYDTPGEALGIAVAGNLAFLADGTFGLQVLDITDPTSPTPIGTYDTPGEAWGVAVAGDLVFVVDGGLGLLIFDISIPTAPNPVGAYDTPGFADAVAVAGDLAFVADGFSGLQLIDITDPSNPTLVGSYDTPGFARGVTPSGDLVFVADDTSGVHVIDITDPTLPVLVGSYDTPGVARSVDVEGDLIYVADGGSGDLQVIDITDPATPTPVSSYYFTGYAHRVTVLGDVAYVAGGISAGLQVFDVSDPANPVLRWGFDTPGSARDVVVAGTHAFVADHSSGLQVVEARTLAGPERIAIHETPGYVRDVAASGNLAVVGDEFSLEIIDITDPAAPVSVATYDTSGFGCRKVALSGDLAYSIGGNLNILDVTNPASPFLVGTLSPSVSATALAVTGDLALLGAYELYIVDIQDPANPVLISTYSDYYLDQIQDICVEGDLVYVADAYDMQVVDIGDPATPTKIGHFAPGEMIADISVEGDQIYVVDRYYGVDILDISDPTTPTLIATYPDSGLSAIALSGDLAFLAEGSTLHVVDVSDLANPTLITSLADSVPTASLSGMVLAGEHLLWPRFHDLQIVRAFQSLNECSAQAWSLPVNDGSGVAIRSRLAVAGTPGFLWEVTADGGAQWQGIVPGPTWDPIASPGTDLRWRATKSCFDPGLNPIVTGLVLEWLYPEPGISSIVDIPNDQGKQVRVEWARSGHDFIGDATPITDYAVYRRIDPDLASAPQGLRSSSLGAVPPGVRLQAQVLQFAGWDFVTTVPARAEDAYAVVVPTLADSTITEGPYYTTFMVSAITTTPGVFYDSLPDSGYSVDNTAPAPPQGLAAAYSEGTVYLTWNPAPEPDFKYFRVYRSDDPGFVPGPANLVHETTSTGWGDGSPDPGSMVYKITALDHSGNESDPGFFGAVTAVGRLPGPPSAYALRAAVPNPFQTQTRIVFDLPQETDVHLDVFDVSGRLVRSLARRSMPAGTHEVSWEGVDQTGRRVAPGVYLYRLRAGGFEAARRMVVVR